MRDILLQMRFTIKIRKNPAKLVLLEIALFLFFLIPAGNSLGQKAESLCPRILSKLINRNDFEVERGLVSPDSFIHSNYYSGVFGSGFLSKLKRLTRDDHWLNAGAGSAFAERDYLAGVEETAKVTSVGVKRPRGNRWDSKYPNDKYRYLEGRYIEDIPLSELKKFGKPKVITDLFGPLAYSHRPDLVMAKYLSLLHEDGTLFIRPGVYTSFTKGDKVFGFGTFLKMIPGVNVKQLKDGFENCFEITVADSEKLRVPKLELLFLDVNTRPPERQFRVK